MTGLTNQGPERERQHLDDRLDRFESEWRSGPPPDIRRFLEGPESKHAWYRACLIQVDLEYRWKQYDQATVKTSVDAHGFPLFPKLEDYATLEILSPEILFTPEMVAEEYRVRMRWGDRPDRTIFFSRFPDDAIELKAALNRVDTELRIECSTPSVVAGLKGSQSTDDYSNADSQTTGSPLEQTTVPAELGRYRLESLIGRGGFGEVWKAYDPKLDRAVAIKIPRSDRRFPPEVLADFEREGQKLAKLGKIPGVVAVYDTGTCVGHTYIVSELIEGESLESRQKRCPLSHQEIVQIISAVAETLHRAHLKDLVHRDIKPANILLNKDGSAVIADFGLAVTETEQLTESRRVVGTLAYMPPEQVSGNSHLANAQADIYSLGVVLYQLLTGRLPFVARSFDGILEQITKRAPRAPRTIDENIPEKLERVCLRCLEKRPEDRYQTAKDLAAKLQQSLIAPRFKRKPIAVASAVILLLIGLAVAASFYPRSAPAPPPSKPNTPPAAAITGHNLLSSQPEPIIWDPGYLKNNIGDALTNKRFSVQTKGDAVFSFGTSKSNHFTYRVVFHMLKEPYLRIGLMWGHGMKPNVQPQKAPVEQAQAIIVEPDEEHLRLRIVRLKFTKGNTTSMRIGHHTRIKEKLEAYNPLEIELEIQEGFIKSLSVQGEEIDEIRTSKRVFQEGDLGVYLSNGDFVITEAWYCNKEKNNGEKK